MAHKLTVMAFHIGSKHRKELEEDAEDGEPSDLLLSTTYENA